MLVSARKYADLLAAALQLAQQLAAAKPSLVREILATGTVQGFDEKLQSPTASVSYKAQRYKRTWHTLIPWEHLEQTTIADEAESMIATIESNIDMTETNSWPAPKLSNDGKRKT